MLGDVCQCGLDILFERERRFSYEFSFFLLRRVYKKVKKRVKSRKISGPQNQKLTIHFCSIEASGGFK
jgi:hypothetical protein